MISWSKYGDVWKAARQAAAPARPAGIPVVYSPQYNISFWGLEKLHPFDPCKFKKIMRALDEGGALKQVRPAVQIQAHVLVAIVLAPVEPRAFESGKLCV